MIACFAWLVICVIGLLFPTYYDAVFGWLQPVVLGEMAFALWLLIKGAKVAAVPAETSVSSSGV
jgi:hypothetical protein